MYKFTITNGYLNIQIIPSGNQILNIPKVIVASNFLELYKDIPIVDLYNSTCDNQSIFKKPLSECVDSNDVPFTVDSLIEFCQENLGFNLPEVPGNITVVNDYNALPDPTTVPDEFYWCQNAVSGYPVGLYYSNGISWEYASSTNIAVVANYAALPNPTSVPDTFYWCENSQGTSWLPGSLGGTYYNSGLYYSNGVSWSFMNVPYQATQNAVDAGLIDNQFLTPLTFTNAQQLKAIVVSSNVTAILNRTLSVVANATITDPSPVEGMPYYVNVVNGTATVGGVSYTVGYNLIRVFHSGSWRTFSYVDLTTITDLVDNTLVKLILEKGLIWQLPNINGSYGSSGNTGQFIRILVSPVTQNSILTSDFGMSVGVFETTTVAGTSGGIRRSDSINLQSFDNIVTTRCFTVDSNISNDCRYIVGFSKNYQFAFPSNAEPTTFTDCILVAKLSTSNNLFVVHNDNTGTATNFDLGSDFPANSSLYRYKMILIKETASSYYLQITRTTISNNATISSNIYHLTSDLPTSGGVLQQIMWINNNASAVNMKLGDYGLFLQKQ